MIEIYKDEKMVPVTEACRFCGQIQTFEAPEGCGDRYKEMMATKLCSCMEAKAYCRKMDAAVQAREEVRELFDDADIIDIFGKAIEQMDEGKLVGITIDFGDGVKGQVKVTNKGAVLIRKTKVTQESKEV